MPIPKKPDELREMIVEKIVQHHHKSGFHYPSFPMLADAAMAALAEYDPCFAKAAALGEPTFTLRAQDSTSEDTVWFWVEASPCRQD